MAGVRKVDFKEFFGLETSVERIKFLLRLATLAPSTHNSQPWKFYIQGDCVHVYYDPKLKLPVADPEGRYLFISVGAMVEQLLIAAHYYGVLSHYQVKIEPTTHKVAEIVFEDLMKQESFVDENLSSQMHAIITRKNVRDGFEPMPLSIELERELIRDVQSNGIEVNVLTYRKDIEAIAQLTEEGTLLANKDKAFRKEISKWMVPNTSYRKDGLNGKTLGLSTLQSLAAPTLIKHIDMGKTIAPKHKKHILSSSMICIFSATENSPKAWFQVGRKANRCMLKLKTAGFGHSVFTAALEYGDAIDTIQEITKSSKTPLFLFAAGQVTTSNTSFSKRHDIDDKIMQTPLLSHGTLNSIHHKTTPLLNLNMI